MGADLLLSKLDKVRKTGPESYHARCPAHDDREPSLSIRDTNSGMVLIHCFAGCSPYDVVSAVGLEMSDLFPPRQHNGKPERRPFPAADALRAVAFEALIVATAGSALLAGKPFSDVDRERLVLAVSRINSAVSAVMPEMRRAHHV